MTYLLLILEGNSVFLLNKNGVTVVRRLRVEEEHRSQLDPMGY